MAVIHPWLEPLWTRWRSLGERAPHALLIAGAPGLGKRDLAEAIAAGRLCDAPRADGQACELCLPCQWRMSGNHPDLHRLSLENREAPSPSDEGEGEGDEPGSARPAKSAPTQIVIDQVRAVQEALCVTAHRGGGRVVIVDPAEAMNPFTANALLKLLEEPPGGCTFLLVSSAPRRLSAQGGGALLERFVSDLSTVDPLRLAA